MFALAPAYVVAACSQHLPAYFDDGKWRTLTKAERLRLAAIKAIKRQPYF